MVSRKGLVYAAACAALALAQVARAEDASIASPAPQSAGHSFYPGELSLSQPLYLDAATAPATAPAADTAPASAPASAPSPTPTPLMGLLAPTPVGAFLSSINTSIGGHLEGSYTFQTQGHSDVPIDGRAFDVDNEQGELNQAQVAVDRPVDVTQGKFDVGAHFEIVWGTDSRFIHSLGNWDTQHAMYQWDVTQAYVDFAIPTANNNGLRIRAGKFVTLAGYEVIDPTGNPLYSHSILFGFAIPFTQTGAYLTYQINPTVQLNLGSSRGWDTSLKSYNDNWDGFGSLVFTVNTNTTLTVDAIVGKDEPTRDSKYRELLDVILTTKVSDYSAITFNGDYGHEDHSAALGGATSAQWYGGALYYQQGMDRVLSDTPMFTLNARVEYFNDDKGVRVPGAIGTGVELMEGTIGVAITPFRDNPTLSTLVFRPEFRADYANKDFFDAGAKHSQFTAAIDAIYKF